MQEMFQVRHTPHPTPPPAAVPQHAATCHHPHHTREPSRTTHEWSCLLRQGASEFNQPLAWDTSRVTTMQGMFRVRYTPRHAHRPWQHTCNATCNHSHPRKPCRAIHPIWPLPGCASWAGIRTGIQPAARVERVERDHHARYVPGALCRLAPPPTRQTQTNTTPPCADLVLRAC